jgi:hypothetical protein
MLLAAQGELRRLINLARSAQRARRVPRRMRCPTIRDAIGLHAQSGQHEDVEQFGAGSGTKGVQALT